MLHAHRVVGRRVDQEPRRHGDPARRVEQEFRAISSILVLEPLSLLATVGTSVGGGEAYTRSKSHV